MTIGLITHDAEKKLMQSFCIAYRGVLGRNMLCVTSTTGCLIEEVANLNAHKYLIGHLGGMRQVAAQTEHNEMDLVIFLHDLQDPKSYEPDVNDVAHLCDIYSTPLTTNLVPTELLIKALDRGDMKW